MDVRPHQALLQDLVSQDLIEVLTQAQKIPQAKVCVNIPDHDPQDQGCVIKSELLEALAPLQEGARDDFPFREHLACVLLVALQLSQEHVHFILLDLVYVAEVDKQLGGLIEGHRHVAKVLDELAQLVDNQVGVLRGLLVELLLLRLHQALDLSVKFAEPFVENCSSIFD